MNLFIVIPLAMVQQDIWFCFYFQTVPGSVISLGSVCLEMHMNFPTVLSFRHPSLNMQAG